MLVQNTNWASQPLGIAHQGLYFTKYKLASTLQSLKNKSNYICSEQKSTFCLKSSLRSLHDALLKNKRWRLIDL